MLVMVGPFALQIFLPSKPELVDEFAISLTAMLLPSLK